MKLVLAVLLCISTIQSINYYTYKPEEMTISPALNPYINASQSYKITLKTPDGVANLPMSYRQLRIVYLQLSNVTLCPGVTSADVKFNGVKIGTYQLNGTMQYFYVMVYVQIGSQRPDEVEILLPQECSTPPEFTEPARMVMQIRTRNDVLYAIRNFDISNEQPQEETTQADEGGALEAQHDYLQVKPNIRQFESTCLKIKLLQVFFIKPESTKISITENASQSPENYPLFGNVPQNCRVRVNDQWRNLTCTLSQNKLQLQIDGAFKDLPTNTESIELCDVMAPSANGTEMTLRFFNYDSNMDQSFTGKIRSDYLTKLIVDDIYVSDTKEFKYFHSVIEARLTNNQINVYDLVLQVVFPYDNEIIKNKVYICQEECKLLQIRNATLNQLQVMVPVSVDLDKKFKILLVGKSIKNFTEEQKLELQLFHYENLNNEGVPVTELFSYQVKLQNDDNHYSITVEDPSLNSETIIRISGKFPNMNEPSSDLSTVKLYLNELINFNYFDYIDTSVPILSQSPNLFKELHYNKSDQSIEATLNYNVTQDTEFYFEFKAELNVDKAGLLQAQMKITPSASNTGGTEKLYQMEVEIQKLKLRDEGSQVVIKQDYSMLRFSFSIDREIFPALIMVLQNNEYFEFASPVVLDHNTGNLLSSETKLLNYPSAQPDSGFKAISGTMSHLTEVDAKYFVDLKLNAKTATFPTKIMFTIFMVSPYAFTKNKQIPSPIVSNVLEVEAFLNCPENCAQCVPNQDQAMMSCQGCVDGFTLNSGLCVQVIQ